MERLREIGGDKISAHERDFHSTMLRRRPRVWPRSSLAIRVLQGYGMR